MSSSPHASSLEEELQQAARKLEDGNYSVPENLNRQTVVPMPEEGLGDIPIKEVQEVELGPENGYNVSMEEFDYPVIGVPDNDVVTSAKSRQYNEMIGNWTARFSGDIYLVGTDLNREFIQYFRIRDGKIKVRPPVEWEGNPAYNSSEMDTHFTPRAAVSPQKTDGNYDNHIVALLTEEPELHKFE